MKECNVKDIVIGKGKPKICIPIVGKTDKEILIQAKSISLLEFDIVELRIDHYRDVLEYNQLLNLLKQLRTIINRPILFTYRSLKEGGQIQLSNEQYKEIIQIVCESQLVDLVDIELESGNILVYQLVEIAHKYNIKVIMSNHDFDKTPHKQELIDRLERMEAFGADICKIAVMPQSKQDVIRLLEVTSIMSDRLSIPLITMSMGQLGVISRISGELFGSSVTFACAEVASAPGQISVNDMNKLLEVLHND